MECPCPLASRVPDGGMIVCIHCGRGFSPVLEMGGGYDQREPGRQPYSRAKRFSRLLANVWGHRVTVIPAGLVMLLDRCRVKSTSGIMSTIRWTRNRKFKRYDALAFLAREYLGKRIAPLEHSQIVHASHIFNQIERLHSRIGGCFPAYSYIIEKILQQFDRKDLCGFLHVLKCKKRRLMYDLTYHPLIKSLCGNSESADTHSGHHPQIQARLNRSSFHFGSRMFPVGNGPAYRAASQLSLAF